MDSVVNLFYCKPFSKQFLKKYSFVIKPFKCWYCQPFLDVAQFLRIYFIIVIIFICSRRVLNPPLHLHSLYLFLCNFVQCIFGLPVRDRRDDDAAYGFQPPPYTYGAPPSLCGQDLPPYTNEQSTPPRKHYIPAVTTCLELDAINNFPQTMEVWKTL